MKLTILITLITLSLTLAGKIIPPNTENESVLFIYHSGKAVMHEYRNADVNKSNSIELTFTDLPNALVGEEVRISSGKFNPVTTYISHNPINQQQLLIYFEGKKISLATMLESGTLSNPVPATLISYEAGQAVYGFEEKVMVNPQGMQPVFPYVPENLTENPNVISTGVAAGGKTEFLLSYFLTGLTWKAAYHIHLSDNNFLDLTGNYLLKNNSTDTFEDMEVFLVSAQNKSESPHPPPVPRREMAYTASFKPADQSNPALLQDVEDYEIYQITEPLHLPENSTVQAVLLPQTEIPFVKEYVATHHARFTRKQRGRNQSEEDAWDPVSLQLNIKTSEIFDQHLPPGQLYIYQELKGYSALIGEQNIKTISKGNNVRVDLKKSQDILYQFRYTDQNETDRGKSMTITGKFKNLKAEAVNVKWLEVSRVSFSIKDSSVEFVQPDIFSAQTVLSIPEGATVEESITIFYPKSK